MEVLRRNSDDVLYDLTDNCQYQKKCISYQKYGDCPNDEKNCSIAEEERGVAERGLDKKIREVDEYWGLRQWKRKR